MLLLQQNNFCIDNELLTYYINLGFNKFCVGSIEQAKQIKKFLPSAEVIASITMKITYEEFIYRQASNTRLTRPCYFIIK